MSKIKSPEPFWKTFAPYSKVIEKSDSSLLSGRKYILIGCCCLPVLSLINANIATILKISIATSALLTIALDSIFEKHENALGRSLCNKIITYSFTSAPGLALSLELIDVLNPVIAVVCGVAVSVFFSLMMYKVIER